MKNKKKWTRNAQKKSLRSLCSIFDATIVEKKGKDSSAGSSGGFTMMCVEVSDPQETKSDKNSEVWAEEESLTLQDWIHQSHKNEI